MPTYNSFEELDCWQKCKLVRNWIFMFAKRKAIYKDVDLRSNLIRASRSTTRNIAEGFGRFHYKDNIRFCRISRGSLFEIKDDLIFCLEEKAAAPEILKEGFKLIGDAIHSIHGYIRYLKTKNGE